MPRAAARVEDCGPLRLFVSEGVPWPYYARPAGGDITAEDVRTMRSRQWELGVPEAFEWVAELAPTLTPAARAAGLAVDELPLMVLRTPLEAPAVAATLRRLEPDDPALAASRAVADIAFGVPGTDRGDAGPRERDAAVGNFPEARLATVRERMAAGLTITVVAEDEDGIEAVGTHQPVGDVTEVVGVATLPSARRRGLGAAVTAALVDDARRGGAEIIFLSAGSDDIARVYGRLGFERVGTAGLAQPAVSS
ncbi:MAG TPA: GNAT family N-acetyltransferase [Solirubrobacteraceae bacterium]|nr:GNAT family N-acetyltransferase [Solirubrobacteraceae bacterium]